MVVVEERQGHVRTCCSELLHVCRVHERVTGALENQSGLREQCTKGVVLERVLVEGVREPPRRAVRVMEELELAALLPDLDLVWRQHMMPGIAEPDRRREQDETADAIGEACSRQDRERAAKARSDERRGFARCRKLPLELLQHPRH